MRDEDSSEEEIVEKPSIYGMVYEGNFLEGVPEGFNAVTIRLDGGSKADLNWTEFKNQALKAVEKGYYIFWDIDLGLDQLNQPIENNVQFLSLTLSLEHFREGLWKDFKSHTLGISLYRGVADFSTHFIWSKQQEENFNVWLNDHNLVRLQENKDLLTSLFCRDVMIEYISLLAARLPDTLPSYIFLESSRSYPLYFEMQYFNPERYERLHLVLKDNRLPLSVWGWGKPSVFGFSGLEVNPPSSSQNIEFGVCVPSMNLYETYVYQEFEKSLQVLLGKNIPFKLISENDLTSQWDGLDFLFYNPQALSPQGKRKLQGFCAAGGTVVSTGIKMNFSQEMDVTQWLSCS